MYTLPEPTHSLLFNGHVKALALARGGTRYVVEPEDIAKVLAIPIKKCTPDQAQLTSLTKVFEIDFRVNEFAVATKHLLNSFERPSRQYVLIADVFTVQMITCAWDVGEHHFLQANSIRMTQRLTLVTRLYLILWLRLLCIHV